MAEANPKYDFSGYVTKNDTRCTDGRTIRQNAFAHQNGEEIPFVWQHQRNEPDNIIGKVKLENRNDGVYGYVSLNDSPKAQQCKRLVQHGDLKHMSIFANQLLEKSKQVLHGEIREASLVLAGANPGAVIDNVYMVHADGTTDEVEGEAIIYTEEELVVEHADNTPEETKDDPTFKEVFDSLNKDQKTLLYAMVEHALDTATSDDEDEDEEVKHMEGDDATMKQNIFENGGVEGSMKEKANALQHDDNAMENMFEKAKKYGSMKMAVEETALEHGITNIEYLFDEEKLVRNTPDMITRDMGWVTKVYDAATKVPFSRIKSMAANLTADEARARGYIKGKKKVDQQFALLKRSTTPQTVYKKQSFDRDDIADITSFDVIAWVKSEMRIMLREELARACLVGDGRNASSDDKINETNIRPIYGDDPMYTVYQTVTLTGTDSTKDANAIIDAANYARIDYKGSGNPVMFTTSKTMTDLMLAKDTLGRRLYNTKAEIASAMRVADIIEVPVLDNVSRTDDDENKHNLVALIYNPRDYTFGSNKMGQVTMFDDFDIDYNKQKYLIETRQSGALTLPYSAIAIETTETKPVTPPTGG